MTGERERVHDEAQTRPNRAAVACVVSAGDQRKRERERERKEQQL